MSLIHIELLLLIIYFKYYLPSQFNYNNLANNLFLLLKLLQTQSQIY